MVINKEQMLERNEKILNQTLNELEDLLWDDEFINPGIKVEYTDKTMASATKIFIHVLLNKMWEYQEAEGMSKEERMEDAVESGKAIRKLILDYTGLDMHDAYKETNG